MLKILPFSLIRHTSLFHIDFILLPRKHITGENTKKLGLETGSSNIFVTLPNKYSLCDSVTHVD
jgi:hypothetical protein